MELNPRDNSIKRRSAVHHVSATITAGNDTYSLQEKALGHLVIRLPEINTEARKAIKLVTGLELPSKPLTSVENNHFVINWISPDEFLLLTADKIEAGVESKLREKMSGHFSIADVSGGQTMLVLSGERAESIIKKSAPYDIHPSNFPVGKVVTTVFAKSQVVIRRTGADSFELIIRRSFSDYLWQWIVDAGKRA
jgi:sarcosine oxidase subunit gamma